MRIQVLFFHPFPRRSTTSLHLKQAIEDLPEVQVRDLYESYPDFFVDVEREQELLLQSDVLIFQHPMSWYSCPALMKEWMDTVLERGWAYGNGGNKLEGKHWIQVVTTGATQEAYQRNGQNEFTMTELLRPFERTARLCGMKVHAPLIIHGSTNLAAKECSQPACDYRALVENALKGHLPPEYNSTCWKVDHEFPRLP